MSTRERYEALFGDVGVGATEGAIGAFEAGIGRSLPADYVEMLSCCDGGALERPFVCPVPHEAPYPEAWVEVNEIAGTRLRSADEHAELISEWNYPVSGVVLDALDGHRAIILVLDGDSTRVGSVVLVDTDWSEEGSAQVIQLAPDFTSFLAALRDDDEAITDDGRDPATELVLGPKISNDQLRSAVAALGGRRVAIRSVVVHGKEVTDAGLGTLAALTDLAALDCSGTQATFATIRALRHLPISRLAVAHTAVELDERTCRALKDALGWLVRLEVAAGQIAADVRAFLDEDWPGLEVVVRP